MKDETYKILHVQQLRPLEDRIHIGYAHCVQMHKPNLLTLPKNEPFL